MRKQSKMRLANGIVSAIIVVLFLVHGALGSALPFLPLGSPPSWLIWAGVGLIGLHVVISVFTSREQLVDPDHPASARKKRHLALKWATGGALAIIAGIHIATPLSATTTASIIVVLSVALAAHICVGSKSLLKDLGIDRRFKTAFRIVICLLAAAFVIAAIASALF